QVAHMYITRQAFELYMSQHPDSDLARYIGEYSGDQPKRRDDANVVAGAFDRAYKYWTGGYGVEGRYDDAWSENKSARRGTKGHGAVYLYQHGEKAKA